MSENTNLSYLNYISANVGIIYIFGFNVTSDESLQRYEEVTVTTTDNRKEAVPVSSGNI